MATNKRTSEHLRYRYGICLNENCDKCKSKEVQEIPTRKEFICQNPECGKPLRECPPPKKGISKQVFLGILAALLVVGGVVAYLLFGGKEKESLSKPKPAVVATIDSDSILAAQQADEQIAMKQKQDSLQAVADSLARITEEARLAEEKAKEKAQSTPAPAKPVMPTTPRTSSGSKDLGYATFKGTWPNDVNGRMIFKTSHVIDNRDPKGRIAEAGDYVIGEFSEGHLVQGIWYGADNVVKGSVIIGK